MSDLHITVGKTKLELTPELINRYACDLVEVLAEGDHADEELRETVKTLAGIIYLYASEINKVHL